jgi:hypothetical protein
MTYPDSGAPADPRDELAAIRRRLAEITPAGPRGAGNGLLVGGGLALAAALVALIVTLAVASTLDGSSQAAVLVAGICAVLGFAVLGLAVLRRWQARSSSVSRERRELLARHDELAAGLGRPRPPAREPAPWPNRNDRFRMVVGTILGVLVLAAVVTTILLRTT